MSDTNLRPGVFDDTMPRRGIVKSNDLPHLEVGIADTGEDNEQLEDTRWESTKECFDGHVPEPKNLPWRDPSRVKPCGEGGDETEETCGTQAYCELFSENSERRQVSGSPYIWTKRQCFEAHEMNPAIFFPED
ncbi:reverse transcriptase [Metarhizium robertsii ARSEF 23]|uniref:Reverse transcriptase n=1 Tax=Metarhizium robertsii (strain ARSEF 23 / ATCC MYA-3075) TaxID=655844 RepID=A0A0B2XD62_METRA|nr:reverse transcriptase [Metarhizium robertsii ARSEF 23]KHO10640.1 reverse transcriptase [Metarhizium robertsii ARSEF 23]